MKKDHILGDVIGALMLSYATIITMFQIVNRFLTPLYGALLIIAGLIAAVVFLFIDEDNRRNMRIASISCNSIAIGSIMGVLFQLLNYDITIFESVIIGGIFLGIVFLIYFFFYHYDSRLVPGVVGGTILLLANILYWSMVYPIVPANYNVYIVMFATITIIHFIIALIVVCSDKKTIIDGMSYGYFGLTLVILVVAGIFLLIASEGDVDLDIGSGADFNTKGKSRDVKSHKTHITSSVEIDHAKQQVNDIARSLEPLADDYIDYMNIKQTYIMENSFYLAYLGSVVDSLSLAQIKQLNTLEKQYRDGIYNKQQYENILDNYK